MAVDSTNLADTVWDVVVVGCGAAGLMTCLELPQDLRILLLSKDGSPRSASRWAQGGIAAVVRPEDSAASHIDDTLKAGAGLCDPGAVAVLVHEAPDCVQRLLELGMAFDRDNHVLSTTLEAAHSHRRVLHAQDRTGGALVDALERQVQLRPNVLQCKGVVALDLWLDGDRCVGLQVIDEQRISWLSSRAVVLASGGGGHLFAHTTNPNQASGDGVAMAYQAGATLRDLEFVQFHPTALMLPQAPHFLISEAVRGEGARLHDAAGHSPVAQLAGADLAPRDQVSRALARTMAHQGVDQLWLDLRPVGAQRLLEQFPTIVARCRELGIDPMTGSIPVAPAAHYWMGGIATDLDAATSIPGLYAVGEVASTGVHGANRLASNSLMECLVFARRLGRHLAAGLSSSSRTGPTPSGCNRVMQRLCGTEAEVSSRLQQLRLLCWQVAGVERQGSELSRGLQRVRQQRQQIERWPQLAQLRQLEGGDAIGIEPGAASLLRAQINLRNRLILAELLIAAALFRSESRGGHYRTDSPASQPFWQCHTVQQRGRPIGTARLC
ncbi:MAG: L-aspartate oxidase [Cyanobacteria bacterium K_DeepCast_35m_m2_023]|nr:L-aspartate oxidase [Cyanobacteria bacterium K_DeepCast_35m_m2_023]